MGKYWCGEGVEGSFEIDGRLERDWIGLEVEKEFEEALANYAFF